MKKSQCSKNKGRSDRLSTSKPLCDCQLCECKNCPDFLQKLALSSKRSKTGFGLKGAKRKKSQEKRPPPPPPRRPSILDSLNPDRNCDCEIMARAIRSHIHMNIGMSDRHRHSRHSDQRPSNSKDVDD